MRDILKSRGFWITLTTLLSTIALQFPQTEPWVNVLVTLCVALATHFGVALSRRRRGDPPSYAYAEMAHKAYRTLSRWEGP